MTRPARSASLRYAAAIAAVAVALYIRHLIDPILHDRQTFVTLYGALAFVIWFSGFRAAIFSLALGGICVEIFFVSPRGFTFRSDADWVPLLAYALTSSVMLIFGYVAARSERKSHDDRVRLEMAQNAATAGSFEWILSRQTVLWSDELRAIFGVAADACSTLDLWKQHLHPEDRDQAVRRLLGAMESESGDYENAYRIVTPAGQVKHVLSRGKVLRGATGKPERIIGLVIDISAQHATEEALLRTEKLAAAGRMAATVAHEINNPLQAVLSTLFLVRRDPTISAAGAQLAQTAEEEIRRVASLAQRSLSFFREARAKTNLSLSQLVSEVAEVYRSQAERANIRYEVEVVPDCVVRFNAAELKQVLSNLIINALDAMPNGGTLTIQAHTGGEWLELQVEDSGSGIEARLLDKIFDPFFTTKESIGTGLGLWVSKNIIEANGGTLRVETQTASDRHGSKFIVRLPLNLQKASTAN